jgi:acetylornithine aminotransferase
MMAKKQPAEVFQPGSHGSTFGGNPLASTAGLATIEEIVDRNIVKNAAAMGQYMIEQLEDFQSKNPIIKQIRGKGLLIGMEVEGPAGEITKQALKENLLILTAGPNVVRVLPPLTVEKEEIDLFIHKLNNTFKALAKQAK